MRLAKSITGLVKLITHLSLPRMGMKPEMDGDDDRADEEDDEEDEEEVENTDDE